MALIDYDKLIPNPLAQVGHDAVDLGEPIKAGYVPAEPAPKPEKKDPVDETITAGYVLAPTMEVMDRVLGGDLGALRDYPGAFMEVERRNFARYGKIGGAAFRSFNGAVSLASWLADQNDNQAADPKYSAWSEIAGTKYEHYWSSFVDSNTASHTATIKRRIDQQEEDRDLLSGAGVTGWVMSMGAGLLDPTVFIPVGGELAKVGEGYSILRSGLRMAGAAGLSAAAQEGVLLATQETKDPVESGLNVGASVVLGGLLGSGASALMSTVEKASARRALDNMLPGGELTREGSLFDHVVSEGSAGAAEADKLGLGDLTVAGKGANFLARMTQFNPILRSNFRPVAAARQVMQELAENTVYQVMHALGKTTGASAETLARVKTRARLTAAIRDHDEIFSNMKKSGRNMARQDFEAEVGRAMREGDQHANPFVAEAAQAWRKHVFDPFKEEAVAAGLLPEDVSVETATSYFSRRWNAERLNAGEADFKALVTGHFSELLSGQFMKHVQTAQRRLRRLDKELADLRLSPEDRLTALSHIEDMGAALDAANAAHVERVSRINDLKRDLMEAAKRGDAAEAETARKEIARLMDEGGQGLKEYLSRRKDLRRRRKAVDLNYAGMMDRHDRILQALVDNEERNDKAVARLVERGRVVEKEALRLDPEKHAKKLGALQDAYAAEVKRSEAAVERARKAQERIDAEAKARAEQYGTPGLTVEEQKVKARLDRHAADEARRAARMEALAERIRAAQALDPEAALEEVKAATAELVKTVSDASLRRGERQAMLKARLEKLDTKAVDARVKAVEALKRKVERDFYDRWEIQHMGEGVELSEAASPDFGQAAREIADEVFDKLTGRAVTDSGSVLPEYLTPITRGPLKDRTFNIPDALVAGFLEDNVRAVGEHYARTMAAEIELTKKFGRADMKEQIAQIGDAYAQLRQQVMDAQTAEEARALIGRSGGKGAEAAKTKEDVLRWLAADEKAAKRDIEAVRDLIRGTYKAAENASNFGRLSRSLMAFNYIRSMGGAVIANMAELYRPAMVHGLRAYLGEGLAPLLKNLDAVKLSVEEAQLAGQVTEAFLHHRMLSMGEIADPFAQGTALERLLQNGAKLGSKWNGLVLWTDAMKSISSVMSQNRILKGVLGQADDTRFLAYLGVDSHMAERIAGHFRAHGDVLDGVHVANTEKWLNADGTLDRPAVEAYRAAVSKDVDSIIVTKSVGDVPLFANTPLGKMILQFRTYALAAHQRVTLRGLQENPRRFVSGLVGATALGIMAAYARAWRGGQSRFEKFKASAENPGHLIAEGLDLGGLFALPVEVGNSTEKLTQAFGFSFNPVKTPIRAAFPGKSQQGDSVRFASRDPWSALLGPTAGLVATTARAAGVPQAAVSGKAPGASAANAAISLLPFNSYLGMREVLQATVADDSPYVGDQ